MWWYSIENGIDWQKQSIDVVIDQSKAEIYKENKFCGKWFTGDKILHPV